MLILIARGSLAARVLALRISVFQTAGGGGDPLVAGCVGSDDSRMAAKVRENLHLLSNGGVLIETSIEFVCHEYVQYSLYEVLRTDSGLPVDTG